MNRRGFLLGLGATLFTAPAIVHAANIMPIKQMISYDMVRMRLFSAKLDGARKIIRWYDQAGKELISWGEELDVPVGSLPQPNYHEEVYKKSNPNEFEIPPVVWYDHSHDGWVKGKSDPKWTLAKEAFPEIYK